jgi:hypothetical protein
MTSLFSMHTALLRLRCAVATANFESRARQLRRAIEAKFDPDQPRDDQGRWTDADTGHAGDLGDSPDKEANVNDILAKRKSLPFPARVWRNALIFVTAC